MNRIEQIEQIVRDHLDRGEYKSSWDIVVTNVSFEHDGDDREWEYDDRDRMWHEYEDWYKIDEVGLSNIMDRHSENVVARVRAADRNHHSNILSITVEGDEVTEIG